MSTHNQCFEQKYEKISEFFLSENCQFLEVKFSIYLNRSVFVMKQEKCLSDCTFFEETRKILVHLVFEINYKIYSSQYTYGLKKQQKYLFERTSCLKKQKCICFNTPPV